jgi:hypothetical protein
VCVCVCVCVWAVDRVSPANTVHAPQYILFCPSILLKYDHFCKVGTGKTFPKQGDMEDMSMDYEQDS